MKTNHYPCIYALRSLLFLFVAIPGLCAGGIDLADTPASVQDAILKGDYGEALSRLGQFTPQTQEEKAYKLFLEGVILEYTGEHAEAVSAFEEHEKTYPENVWHHKVRFKRAEALRKLRRFSEAEAIYEEEAERLLSNERKEKLAGIYLEFAEEMSKLPAPDTPGAPPPNYLRAAVLYKKVLSLGTSGGLREKAMFFSAHCMQKAKKWREAVNEYQAYLREFDPTDNVPENGTAAEPCDHLFRAQYNLGECLLSMKNHMKARRTWEDLTVSITDALERKGIWISRPPFDKKKQKELTSLCGDALYALSNTFRIQHTQEALLAIATLNKYLNRYPEGTYAPRAAYKIGVYYQQIGRSDEALPAFDAFLSGKGCGKVRKENRQQVDELKRSALYRKGQVFFQQQDYEKAIETWQEYVRSYPTGKEWSDAQKQIITAQYEKGRLHREKEEYAKARQTWNAFLVQHPLDNRSQRILYDLGEMYLEEARGEKEEKQKHLYRQAIEQWKKLVQKYPESITASEAQYSIGRVYAMKLKELEKAVGAYRLVTQGAYKAAAERSLQLMKTKQLTVVTEKTLRSNQPASITCHLQNIKELKVNLYKLDLQAYFRKHHQIRGIETLDLDLISPDSSFTVEIKDYADYKPIKQAIALPVQSPCVYAVSVTAGNLRASTLFLQSDIDIIVKSSRRELFVFAENMLTGAPQPETEICALVPLASSGGNGKSYTMVTGTTNADGVFHYKAEEKLNTLFSDKRLAVLAHHKGHFASDALNLQGLRTSQGLSARGYIYTDRPAYRPGQTVNIKAILRETKNGSYTFAEGRTYTLEAADSRGRVFYRTRLPLSTFGTLNDTVTLDAFAPPGRYTVRCFAAEGTVFSGRFLVEEYQLEQIELSFDLPRDVYYRGENVSGTIRAAYYYGEPVADAQMRYTLPDGRTFTTRTSKDGSAEFSFSTRSFPYEGPLTITAALTEEHVQARKNIFLSLHGFRAQVSTLRDVFVAGERFDVTVKTTSPADKPVGRTLTLKVLEIQTETPRQLDLFTPITSLNTFNNDQQAPLNNLQQSMARVSKLSETLVKQYTVKTDEKTGEAVQAIALDEGGRYTIRIEGEDRFDNTVTSETSVFISGDDDAQKLRFITDTQHLKTGETKTVKLYNRASPGLALVTLEGDEILEYRLVELEKGENKITFDVTHRLFPNFTLTASMMAANNFYQTHCSFSVERRLTITCVPNKETYEPGEKATATLTVTDQLGKPVTAELSLAAVDQALLDAFPGELPDIVDFFKQGTFRSALLRTTTSCRFSYKSTASEIDAAVIRQQDSMLRRLAETRTRSSLRAVDTININSARQEVLTQTATQPQATWAMPQQQQLEGGTFDSLAFGFAETGIGGGGAAAPPAPRKHFLETAYWTPSVVTDKKGKAHVTFQVPSQATRWKLLSVGITKETVAGTGSASFVSKKELFLQIKTPAFLTEGDIPQCMVRIHNATGKEGTAQLKLRITEGEASKTIPLSFDLKKSGVTEQTIPLESAIVLVDQVTFEGDLSADIDGRTLRDVVVKNVPVRPWGIAFADAKSGTVTDRLLFELSLPEGASYKNRRLTVTVGPGIARMLIDEALGRDQAVFRLASSQASITTHAEVASALIGACAAIDYLETMQRGQTPEYRSLIDRAQGYLSHLTATQCKDGGWAWAGGGRSGEARTTAFALWALGRARVRGLPVPPDVVQKGIQFLEQAFKKAPQQANELKAMMLFALSVHGKGDFGLANRLYRLRNSLSPAALAYTTLSLSEMEKKPMAAETAQILEAKARTIEMQQNTQTQCRWPVKDNTAWNRAPLGQTALSVLAIERARPGSSFVKQGADYLAAHRPWQPERARGMVLAALCYYHKKVKPSETDAAVEIKVDGKTLKSAQVNGTAGGFTATLGDIPQQKTTIEIAVKGRGEPCFTAILEGFTDTVKERREDRFYVNYQYYNAAAPVYKGKTVQTGFSVLEGSYRTWRNLVANLPLGALTNVTLDVDRVYNSAAADNNMDYLVVEAPLPAGATVLGHSVRGAFDYYEEKNNCLVFYVGSRKYIGTISYTLLGYLPGTYKILPPMVRSAYDPSLLAVGKASQLNILKRGTPSPDSYRPTPDELYFHGKVLFDDGKTEQAEEKLEALFTEWSGNLETKPYKDTVRMLLFINITLDRPRSIVKYFEIIKEKYPELTIPFEKVLAVGDAYRTIEEYERALLVFRAVIGEAFGKDLKVAGTLEEEGEFFGAVDTLTELWLTYPDLPVVVSTCLTLSDKFYMKADAPITTTEGVYIIRQGDTLWSISQKYYGTGTRWEAIADANGDIDPASMKPGMRLTIPSFSKSVKSDDRDDRADPRLSREALLERAVSVLFRFLCLYADDPQADQAALSLVSAQMKRDDYKQGSALAGMFAGRFAKSNLRDHFVYSEAVSRWYLNQYKEAVTLAEEVATTKYTGPDGRKHYSKNRELALYILGQIYHAQKKIEKAVEYYDQVKNSFPDAREAITCFREKKLQLPEVTSFAPGGKGTITLTYRNIENADLLIYPVDLMRLYLREKNLRTVTDINLAGISPIAFLPDVKLGSGKDYTDKEKKLESGLKEPGAYLVIVRGGDFHTSGLVLVTPLALEVYEDVQSGRVRVQVLQRDDQTYVRNVEVKVIGTQNKAFVSGKSDPRGLFIADAIMGKATVIARAEESRYAFYRGTKDLGAAERAKQREQQKRKAPAPSGKKQLDYFDNINIMNSTIQQQRGQSFQKELNKTRKGIQAKQAF